MSESYTKLSSALVHSTVWRESAETRVVWITMLALADQHGEVQASIPGLADVSRVTVTQCEEALQKFLNSDPYSRSQVLEGRRITEIPGGWFIVNHGAYRGLLSMDHKKALATERQRRHRDKQRNAVTRDITPNNGKSLQAEAKAVSSKEKEEEKEREVSRGASRPAPDGAVTPLCPHCEARWDMAPGTGKRFLVHDLDCPHRSESAA